MRTEKGHREWFHGKVLQRRSNGEREPPLEREGRRRQGRVKGAQNGEVDAQCTQPPTGD